MTIDLLQDHDRLLRRAVREGQTRQALPADFTQKVMQQLYKPKHRVWPRWTAAASIALLIGLMWNMQKPGPEPATQADQQLIASLLAPTADDSLRWQVDHEIESRLALNAGFNTGGLCYFHIYSRMIEDNQNPQYVNNVLGRMLMLCRNDGLSNADAVHRQECIDTLEFISAKLLADKQNANNLGIGLCQQCIRALGGTPASQHNT